MKRKFFKEEIIKKLKIEKNKWQTFDLIEKIVLKNGISIKPDWKYKRFFITEKNNILIKYGNSKPYGGKFQNNFSVSLSGTEIYFQGKLKCDNFRLPKLFDIMYFSNKKENFEFEIPIKDVKFYFNKTVIFLSKKINFEWKNKNISFYSLLERKPLSMHSKEQEGVFMNFFENKGRKKYKKNIYHKKIKLKNILYIDLKEKNKNFESKRIKE